MGCAQKRSFLRGKMNKMILSYEKGQQEQYWPFCMGLNGLVFVGDTNAGEQCTVIFLPFITSLNKLKNQLLKNLLYFNVVPCAFWLMNALSF